MEIEVGLGAEGKWAEAIEEGFQREPDGMATLTEISRNYEFHQWPFLMVDYQAAGQWLSCMEAKGLRLVRVDSWGFAAPVAAFRKVEPNSGVDYCMDFFKPSGISDDGDELIKEYLDLCASTGWEYVCNGPSDVTKIFRADHTVMRAVPLQTDPETERAGLRAGFWRSDGGAAILSFTAMGLLIGFYAWLYSLIGWDVDWFAPREVFQNTTLIMVLIAGGILPIFLLTDYYKRLRGEKRSVQGTRRDWKKKAMKGEIYHGIGVVAILLEVTIAALTFVREPAVFTNIIMIVGAVGISSMSRLQQGVALRRVLLLASQEKRIRMKRILNIVFWIVCIAILVMVFGFMIWQDQCNMGVGR